MLEIIYSLSSDSILDRNPLTQIRHASIIKVDVLFTSAHVHVSFDCQLGLGRPAPEPTYRKIVNHDNPSCVFLINC